MHDIWRLQTCQKFDTPWLCYSWRIAGGLPSSVFVFVLSCDRDHSVLSILCSTSDKLWISADWVPSSIVSLRHSIMRYVTWLLRSAVYMGAHMHQKLCGNDVLPIPQPDRLRLSLYPSSLGKFTSSLLPVLAVHTPYSPYRPGIITIGYEVCCITACASDLWSIPLFTNFMAIVLCVLSYFRMLHVCCDCQTASANLDSRVCR